MIEQRRLGCVATSQNKSPLFGNFDADVGPFYMPISIETWIRVLARMTSFLHPGGLVALYKAILGSPRRRETCPSCRWLEIASLL
jgi:hypothetical protein